MEPIVVRPTERSLPRRFDDDRTWILGGGVNIGYDPANDPHQAFELLCWLAERGTVEIRFCGGGMFFFWKYKEPGSCNYPCSTPAELRLAIMRAVCKVKEETK